MAVRDASASDDSSTAGGCTRLVRVSTTPTGQAASAGLQTLGAAASCDPDTIFTWWMVAPYNIGIATGPSKLVVIDCDTSEDTTDWRLVGDDVRILDRLLPRTFLVRTPGGGLHLYFLAPDELRLGNTAGTLGRRVDTRGVGGYVVGPGSVCGARSYAVVDRSPVIELPSWVADALAPKPQGVQAPVMHEYPDAYIRAVLNGEAERVRTAPPGSRNSTLNLAAFLLGQLVGAGRVPEQKASHVLEDAAAAHVGVQGFTEREMRATIRSGLTAGIRRPRYLTRPPRRGADA